MNLKTFSHNISYVDNKFQHIEMFVEIGDRAMRWRGVSTISHTDKDGNEYYTPAAVFGALYEVVLNKEEITFEIDEPAMFQLTATITTSTDRFVFNFHAIQN